MTVAHLIRKFLLPRETFVSNQLSGLTSFAPIVCCHTLINNSSFDIQNTYSSLDHLGRWGRFNSKMSYTLFRSLTRGEIKYFSDLIISKNTALLHIHFCVDARYFLELVKRLRIKTVVSAYGYDVSQFPHLYWNLGKKYLMPIFRRMDLFIAMSDDMKHDLMALGCPEGKITVHYHGIDVERFYWPERDYQNKNPVNILLCGNLEIKKAQHNVFYALRKLQIQGSIQDNFYVNVVGDGPLKNKLSGIVHEYHWEDRVAFHGHIPYSSNRLVDFYRAADIYLLPSITVKHDKEGIPGTIVEAMTSGLPVISTYHAGIPEIIDNNKHGLLVKENDIDDLAAALLKLISDVSLRERLGRSAAEKAFNEFNYKKKARNLEGIYRSLLEQ